VTGAARAKLTLVVNGRTHEADMDIDACLATMPAAPAEAQR
jgi:hypothetical protein